MAITITYTFTPNTTALSAEVNANFSLLASRATDKTGDTLTGTLNTQHLIGTASNSYDLGSTTYFYRTGHLKTSLILGQTTANYTLTWANPASARAISFEDPLGTDIIAYKAATQTLTNKTLGSVLTVSALGTHPISGGGNSLQWLQVTNTASGTAARTAISPIAGTTTASFQAFSQAYTTAGTAFQAGGLVDCDGVGGISVAASHASGDIRLYSRNTLGLTLGASQAAAFTGTVKSSAQPGFLAYNSADDVTQATAATIDFDTEVYDETSNFSSDTFTAPVTGRYLLSGQVHIALGSTAPQVRQVQLVTTNRTYSNIGAFTAAASGDISTHPFSVVADMTSGDTAFVKLNLSTGTVTVGGFAGPVTWFSGRLLV